MEANPTNVVLDSEDSVSMKYFVPMFLRAKQKFEPTAKMMPTTDAEALESGSEPIAEIKTVILHYYYLQTYSQEHQPPV